jgi:hypothetical protein
MHKRFLKSISIKRKYLDCFFIIVTVILSAFFAYSDINSKINHLSNSKESIEYRKKIARDGVFSKIYAPAVMKVCRNKFVNVSPRVKSLNKFLRMESIYFDCKDLHGEMKTKKMSGLQEYSRYQLRLTSFLWRMFGISWKSLIIEIIFFLTVSWLSIYGLMRLIVNPLLSFIASTVLVILKHHAFLYFMYKIRDYSVAPFALFFLFILGAMVKKPFRIHQLIALSLLEGAVLGLGVGFRSDLLIYVPVFIISLFFVNLERVDRKIGGIFILLASFLLSFFIVGYPVLMTYISQSGGSLFHVMMIGLSNPFLHLLGIVSPYYNISPSRTMDDLQTFSLANSYWTLTHGGSMLSDYFSLAYARMGGQYVLEFLKNFPGDFVLHAYLSICNIVFGRYHDLLSFLFLAINIFIMALYRLRIAIFLILILTFLGGYHCIQFSLRHNFFLVFIPTWLFMLFLAYIIFITKMFYHKGVRRTLVWLKKFFCLHYKRAGLFLGSVIFIFVSIFIIARQYQIIHLRKFLLIYENAKLVKVPVVYYKINQDKFFIQPKKLFEKIYHGEKGFLSSEYLVLTFDRALCPKKSFDIQFQHETNTAYSPNKNNKKYLWHYDYNRHTDFIVKINEKTSKLYVPVYFADMYFPFGTGGQNALTIGNRKFSGFVVSAEVLHCMKLYKVSENDRYSLRLMPTLFLPNNINNVKFIQMQSKPKERRWYRKLRTFIKKVYKLI